MRPPTGFRELVPGVTVIVPHGGAERLALLQTTLPRLREVRGIARIVLVELDEIPRAAELGRRCADFHVFAAGVPPFHKTRAMNIGLAFVRTSHFLWLDGDLLMPETFVVDALRECVARDLDCLLPWTEVHYLSEPDSRAVATGQSTPEACVPVNRFTSSVIVPGSSVLVRTEFAHRHGGMAEQFRGWGCEDTAWFIKTRMLGSIAVPEQGTRTMHHLYHPSSGGYSDFKDLFERPDYRRNFAILTLMKSYQTPAAFSRRFPAPAHFTPPWHGTRRFACARGEAAIATVLQELYGDAVNLCDPDSPRDRASRGEPGRLRERDGLGGPHSLGEDAWDAALAAVCRASMTPAAGVSADADQP